MRVTTPELIKKASLEDLENTICTPDGVGEKMKRRILEEIKYIAAQRAQISARITDVLLERED